MVPVTLSVLILNILIGCVTQSSQSAQSESDGEFTISNGGLTQKEVLYVIRGNLNQVRRCYETTLDGIPKPKGSLTAQFYVEKTTGKVNRSSIVRSTFEQPSFHDCIVSRIQLWQFPIPKGNEDVIVRYPYKFSPD